MVGEGGAAAEGEGRRAPTWPEESETGYTAIVLGTLTPADYLSPSMSRRTRFILLLVRRGLLWGLPRCPFPGRPEAPARARMGVEEREEEEEH